MNSNNLVYPIVLTPDELGGYMVHVPDVNKENGGAFTQGENLSDCLYMARDLIGIILTDYAPKDYPKATSLENIQTKKGEIKTLVDINMREYLERTGKTVRKNVSIPDYLVEIGKKKGLNFSEVLTKALEDRLL